MFSKKYFDGNERGQVAKIRYDSPEEQVSRTMEDVCSSGIKLPTCVKKYKFNNYGGNSKTYN
jgi:predicted peroxiredoxin